MAWRREPAIIRAPYHGRMLARVIAACVSAACAMHAGAQALPPEVEAALAAARLPRDALSLYVAAVDAPQAPRLAHRADTPVNPASMAKLVTTYAALELLGPAYAWSTPVAIDGAVRDGTLHGNLYIKGQGDPKLVHERVWLLLRRVQALGIRRIQGDIVLDRSSFEVPPADPGAFDAEPLRPYNATPDALLLNYKAVLLTFTPDGRGTARVQAEPPLAGVQWPATVRVIPGSCSDWRAALTADFTALQRPRFGGGLPAGCREHMWPLAFPDPAGYPARLVAALWRDLGGELTGQVRDGRMPASLKPLFEFASPSLAEVVRDINKYSNNVMAQQLFLTLGLQLRGTGSLPAAREVVRTWWTERIGGEPPVLDNGSGLSRTERITARQLGQMLHLAWSSPLMPELVASLPASGQDGTLRRGRRGGAAAHLKTGSLRDVSGIAGYVHGASGRRYVVVAIANHENANTARAAVDALLEWTARE